MKLAILGDEKYCKPELNVKFRRFGLKRLFLHAIRLEFSHHQGYQLSVEAPLDRELQLLLDRLPKLDKLK